jgi:hypothetical protein
MDPKLFLDIHESMLHTKQKNRREAVWVLPGSYRRFTVGKDA